jgi:uncharacterized phage-associated protein
MPYTPQAIANYFLDKGEEERRDISQMKLQKLVYIAYGWVLAATGERLFDEPIEAWDHGPVIPSLYHEFKHNGSGPILDRAIFFDLDTLEEVVPTVDAGDTDTRVLLDTVWESYKRFSSAALRRKTHEPDTPWSRVCDPNKRHVQLRDADISEHFGQKIREYLDAAEREESQEAISA